MLALKLCKNPVQRAIADLAMTLQAIGEGLKECSTLKWLQRPAHAHHCGELWVGQMKELAIEVGRPHAYPH